MNLRTLQTEEQAQHSSMVVSEEAVETETALRNADGMTLDDAHQDFLQRQLDAVHRQIRLAQQRIRLARGGCWLTFVAVCLLPVISAHLSLWLTGSSRGAIFFGITLVYIWLGAGNLLSHMGDQAEARIKDLKKDRRRLERRIEKLEQDRS
jgi:hypothetical protein